LGPPEIASTLVRLKTRSTFSTRSMPRVDLFEQRRREHVGRFQPDHDDRVAAERVEQALMVDERPVTFAEPRFNRVVEVDFRQLCDGDGGNRGQHHQNGFAVREACARPRTNESAHQRTVNESRSPLRRDAQARLRYLEQRVTGSRFGLSDARTRRVNAAAH
jgi:hypothetical protein